MKTLLIYLILLLSFPSCANSFVLNNVLLPDFETRQLTPVNVEIANGKIKQIVDVHINLHHLDTRDGQGKVMMPALLDMHSHSMGNSSLDRSDYQYIGIRGTANAMLYAGVHGWLDLYSKEKDILRYRDRQFPLQRDEAFVFAAGPCFTVPTGHCDTGDTRLISSSQQAINELSDLSKAKPNVVKIVFDTSSKRPTVDKPTLKAFLNEAKRLNIKSVVHVGSWEDVRVATEFGANAVTHLPWQNMPDDLPKLMKQQGTAFIPTVAIIAELLFLHNPSPEELLASVLSIPMTSALVKEKLLKDYPVTERHKNHYDWLTKLKAENAFSEMQNALLKLDQAGVDILVGSDAANLAMFQGVGFHREMFFLQKMGMSSWDIIAGATYKAYQFLDLGWGLAEGKPAHFTLQNKTIFDDLSQSTQVSDIYIYGRKVHREPLLHYAKPGFFQYAKLFLGFEV
jgi:imidazolonepropionase-like amidohydrolase